MHSKDELTFLVSSLFSVGLLGVLLFVTCLLQQTHNDDSVSDTDIDDLTTCNGKKVEATLGVAHKKVQNKEGKKCKNKKSPYFH